MLEAVWNVRYALLVLEVVLSLCAGEVVKRAVGARGRILGAGGRGQRAPCVGGAGGCGLCLLEVLEVMCCVLLCILGAVECGLNFEVSFHCGSILVTVDHRSRSRGG